MVKKTASGKVSLVQERVSWREDDAQLLEDEAMDEVQEVGLHRQEDDRMPRIIFPGAKENFSWILTEKNDSLWKSCGWSEVDFEIHHQTHALITKRSHDSG